MHVFQTCCLICSCCIADPGNPLKPNSVSRLNQMMTTEIRWGTRTSRKHELTAVTPHAACGIACNSQMLQHNVIISHQHMQSVGWCLGSCQGGVRGTSPCAVQQQSGFPNASLGLRGCAARSVRSLTAILLHAAASCYIPARFFVCVLTPGYLLLHRSFQDFLQPSNMPRDVCEAEREGLILLVGAGWEHVYSLNCMKLLHVAWLQKALNSTRCMVAESTMSNCRSILMLFTQSLPCLLLVYSPIKDQTFALVLPSVSIL